MLIIFAVMRTLLLFFFFLGSTVDMFSFQPKYILMSISTRCTIIENIFYAKIVLYFLFVLYLASLIVKFIYNVLNIIILVIFLLVFFFFLLNVN